MKQIIIILYSLLLGSLASAQNTSYGTTVATSSEFKANALIVKVRETVDLSDEQVNQLVITTSEYWDDLEALRGQRNYEEKLAKRFIQFDSAISLIIKDEEKYKLYKNKFASILDSQRVGYGRRQ